MLRTNKDRVGRFLWARNNVLRLLVLLIGAGGLLSFWVYPDKMFTDAVSSLEFQELHRRIKKMNESEMSYFTDNWPALHVDLCVYLESGQMAELPLEQQETIFMDLEYLRGCYHGDVLRDHGDDIRAITNQLRLTDKTRQFVDELKDITKESKSVPPENPIHESKQED